MPRSVTPRGSYGFAWVTSHVFRKTCATVLDGAGQTPRAVADQLGHAHISTTQDHYFGRRIANLATASDLDVWHDQEETGELITSVARERRCKLR